MPIGVPPQNRYCRPKRDVCQLAYRRIATVGPGEMYANWHTTPSIATEPRIEGGRLWEQDIASCSKKIRVHTFASGRQGSAHGSD